MRRNGVFPAPAIIGRKQMHLSPRRVFPGAQQFLTAHPHPDLVRARILIFGYDEAIRRPSAPCSSMKSVIAPRITRRIVVLLPRMALMPVIS